MSELKFVAEEIKLKVLRLLRETDDLKAECERLRAQKISLEAELERQKNTIHSLKESNKIVKLAGTLVETADDIPALRKKLNEYIREIDECIRFLSERQV